MLKSALWVFLFSLLPGSLHCKDINPVTVKRGESATLQCNGSTGATVVMFRWSKPEQENKQLYVLFVRENRPYDSLQLPSFRGRVELRDPQMKDGNFSVIIKDVSMDDAGVYECYAGYGRGDPQLINSTNLKVVEPGESGHTGGQSGDGEKKDEGKKDEGEESGPVGPIVVLLVSVLIVAAIVGFIIYRPQLCTHDPVNTNEDLEMSPAAVPGSQHSESQEL